MDFTNILNQHGMDWFAMKFLAAIEKSDGRSVPTVKSFIDEYEKRTGKSDMSEEWEMMLAEATKKFFKENFLDMEVGDIAAEMCNKRGVPLWLREIILTDNDNQCGTNDDVSILGECYRCKHKILSISGFRYIGVRCSQVMVHETCKDLCSKCNKNIDSGDKDKYIEYGDVLCHECHHDRLVSLWSEDTTETLGPDHRKPWVYEDNDPPDALCGIQFETPIGRRYCNKKVTCKGRCGIWTCQSDRFRFNKVL